MKKRSAALGLGALVIGTASVFVAGLVNWVLGLVLLSIPIYMVYKAS